MKLRISKRDGSTLVVTIIVVATLLVLLGVAVDYSTQISRVTQRSRKTALAMEIADGHLENLFTNWRNIYRTTWTTQYAAYTGAADLSLCGTNFFATAMYTPSPLATPIPYMNPSGTPPVIPLPSPSNFPTSAYNVTQYRIQAVDPIQRITACPLGLKGHMNLCPLHRRLDGAIAMVEKDRTWNMIMASMASSITGKTSASAALALADSSIGPAISI